MSLDQRMREGMERASAGVDPDVRERFGVARSRARRLRRRQQAMGTLAVAGAVAVAILAGPLAWDAMRDGGTGGAAGPVAAPATPFPIPPGSYTTRISRDEARSAGMGADEVEGFVGSYVFTFAADGSYIWEEATPDPFIKDGGGGTTSFAGDRIRFQDWLHAGSGDDVTVRVSVSPEGLSFSEVTAAPAAVEPFARALFASQPWTPSG